MEDTKALTQVSEFHSTFSHPVLDKPTIPSSERCSLRVSLLSEELDELKVAIENNDIIEIADAFCDLQYVLAGAILEFGLGEKFKELFDEVHRSNMSKACNSVEEAEETILKYQNEGINCYYLEKESRFLIYRKSDNKVMKSINYSPALFNLPILK